VQEALTNTLRHANATHAIATLRFDSDAVDVEVVDDGTPSAAGDRTGGRGLIGFRMILNAEDDIDVIGEAADGAEAVQAAKRLLPKVVLMDVRMPGMNGIEATRRILLSGAGSRVLILTTFDLDEYVYEALRAGASGSRWLTYPACRS